MASRRDSRLGAFRRLFAGACIVFVAGITSSVRALPQVIVGRTMEVLDSVVWGQVVEVVLTIRVLEDIDGMVISEDVGPFGVVYASGEQQGLWEYSPGLGDWALLAPASLGDEYRIEYLLSFEGGTGTQEVELVGVVILQKGLDQQTTATDTTAFLVSDEVITTLPVGVNASKPAVAPNPVGRDGLALFYVAPPGSTSAQMVILDTAGRICYRTPLPVEEYRFPLSGLWSPVDAQGVALPNGAYIVVVVVDDRPTGQCILVIQR